LLHGIFLGVAVEAPLEGIHTLGVHGRHHLLVQGVRALAHDGLDLDLDLDLDKDLSPTRM
jgi:hypothetical protein